MDAITRDSIHRVLSDEFGIGNVLGIEPLAHGVNNRSFMITAPADEYVLKWHLNADSGEHIDFIAHLLTSLAEANLPFNVPAPITTLNGGHLAITPDGQASFSLSRRIVGEHPGVGDPAKTHVCGAALGLLDSVLATIEIDGNDIPRAFTRLSGVHPAVPDPVGAIGEELGYTELAEAVLAIEASWADVTRNWDQQLIHGDFFSPNILTKNDVVTGILDFEFAGLSHRAMDLAVGIKAFALNPTPSKASPELIRTFARGYLSTNSLTAGELHSLPTLILKRESSSFIHWLGRHREGLTDRQDIDDRADRFSKLVRWIHTNQTAFQRIIL